MVRSTKYYLLSALLTLGLQLAASEKSANVAAPSPDVVALNILNNSLAELKTLKKDNLADVDKVRQLIERQLLPYIDTNYSVKLVLEQHLAKLDADDIVAYENYLINQLLNDYVLFVTAGNDQFGQTRISANPQIQRKDNRALIALTIQLTPDAEEVPFGLLMIDNQGWKIYDLLFSGVSLLQTYRDTVDSQIQRLGLEKWKQTLYANQ